MEAFLLDCLKAVLIPLCSGLGLILSKKIPKWISRRKRRKRKSRKGSSNRPTLRPQTGHRNKYEKYRDVESI